jgi:hypothetical protein
MDKTFDKFKFSNEPKASGRIALNSNVSAFDPVGEPVESNGKKTQQFKKEMLSVGHYIHPVWGWHLDITEERLHRLAATFNQMKANGVAVEVPVDHSLSAEDNYGYVTGMTVEKNKKGVLALYGIHEMAGDKGIDLVHRNKGVSVLIEKDFKDGKGNAYGEAITHSSIVQQPVVPGQEDFEAIAASITNKQNIPMLFLSGKDSTMDEFLKKLRVILGADDSLTEENAMSRLAEHISGLGTKNGDLQKQLVDLQGEMAKLKTDNKAASTVQIDPNLAEQMGTTAEQQLDLLVQTGKITPAVKTKLAASLIGVVGSRNVMAMSIQTGGKPSMLSIIVDALKDNDAVKLGEQTGVQSLSRIVPGTESNQEVDKESLQAMSRGAGVEIK